MKIIHIFADVLFAFHYDNEVSNEYERLMDLWTDVAFLKQFAENNAVSNVSKFIRGILQDAEQIQDFLKNLSQGDQPFELYFQPLQNSEYNRLLGFQKGKVRRNRLRYYAIKIGDNCFVITGGAIKMSQTMQQHPDTVKELIKLKAAKTYLNKNGVFDEDSFYELLIEQS